MAVVGRAYGSGLYWELKVAVPRINGGRSTEGDLPIRDDSIFSFFFFFFFFFLVMLYLSNLVARKVMVFCL